MTDRNYRVDYPRDGAIFCRTCLVAFVYVPDRLTRMADAITQHERLNPYRHPKPKQEPAR